MTMTHKYFLYVYIYIYFIQIMYVHIWFQFKSSNSRLGNVTHKGKRSPSNHTARSQFLNAVFLCFCVRSGVDVFVAESFVLKVLRNGPSVHTVHLPKPVTTIVYITMKIKRITSWSPL